MPGRWGLGAKLLAQVVQEDGVSRGDQVPRREGSVRGVSGQVWGAAAGAPSKREWPRGEW